MTIYDDGTYLSRHPQWHAERARWKAGHVLEGLQRAQIAPRTICDIGCGTGLALAAVVAQLEHVDCAVGFEPSGDAPIHPFAQDLIEVRREPISSSGEHFDVALMLDVFEHVEDYLGFLASCRPVAGTFVFHIPLEINAVSVALGAVGNSRATLGHLHHFTRRTALDSLSYCGYKVRYCHYTKASWEGPGRRPYIPINLIRRSVYAISPSLAERVTGGLSLLVVADTAAPTPKPFDRGVRGTTNLPVPQNDNRNDQS